MYYIVNTRVVDPDLVGSAFFFRIRIRIVTEKTDPERIRVAWRVVEIKGTSKFVYYNFLLDS